MQAVAEVYTLEAAGMPMDLAKLPNRGVYRRPDWIQDVKLYKTKDGKYALSYPEGVSAQDLLDAMQTVPEWESDPVPEENEVLAEDAEDLLDPVLPSDPSQIMDPETPSFKKAALVKVDPAKRFDFMSNRPVPRAKPAQPEKVEEVVQAEEPVVQPATPATPQSIEQTSASATPKAAEINIRQPIPDTPAQSSVDGVAALKKSPSSRKPLSPAAAETEGVNWRQVPVTDDLKFAVSATPP